MNAGAVIAIIVVVVVVVALVVAVAMMNRRHRLQQKFGPEYDRVIQGQDSKIKAEAELAGRERRVRGLQIRPLSNPARERLSKGELCLGEAATRATLKIVEHVEGPQTMARGWREREHGPTA